MLNVSNDFKLAMKQQIKELQAYITSGNISITESDDLQSFKISCNSGLCKTAMRKLEASYIGEHNLLGQWVHVGYAVKLVNGTFETLDYGSFLVSEITHTKDTGVTTITGYDKMINAMTTYTELNVTYPINLYDYTVALCTACNLELGNNTFTYNGDYLVNQELWSNIEGITYRDILVQIAQATGTTCIISNDDKVYFKSITTTNENLTYDNMFKLKLEPIYGEINSIVLSRTPQEDNIYKRDEASISTNGLTEFKIENNEIIDKDRDTAIDPIYNALHGISYYPFETTTEGLGWYEIGDEITIINDTNTEFKTAIFNVSITLNGAIRETLKTTAETKTQTQYQYASTTDKKIKNTQLIVNKQNQTIQSLISTTQLLNDGISMLGTDIQESLRQLGQDLSDYQATISTQFTQTATDYTMLFTQLIERINSTTENTNEEFANIQKYIRFVDGNIVLGRSDNQLTLKIQNDRISYQQNGSEVAYFSNNKLYVTELEVTKSLRIGQFAFIPESNGSLSFRKVGG